MGHTHRSLKARTEDKTAQAIIEFTFSMVIVLLLIYASVQIFRWSGVSLAERRIAHENLLITPIDPNFNQETIGTGPLRQIDPYFYKPKKIRAVWGE